MKRTLLAGVALASFASVAMGHYHFVHFPSRSGPYVPIYEKFDLDALPNRTLMYFVAPPNDVQLGPTDSFYSLLSHVQAAAKVWNDVKTSDLRLEFGGIAPAGTPQAAPSMEIVFEEQAPGVVALGGPVIRADSNGAFVPILKSAVLLQADLREKPSYTEELFGTLVHEIGHALGLQHTFTSGVMSTSVTRATTKAKPLTADDVAGISILYSRGNLQLTTGSITGRVTTTSGAGVNLGSVVAISTTGVAISTLTRPDGTYRIDGLPPRTYFIYVHPLPPPVLAQVRPGDINYPLDNQGRPFEPSGPFETIFFPGTKDAGAAFPVQVGAANTVENVNFSVQPKGVHGIHSVRTFAFLGTTAIRPAFLNQTLTTPSIVATGENLRADGLNVRMLNGPVAGVREYSPGNFQIWFNREALAIPSNTPRHLVFSAADDVYVLPSAFFHVSKQPPTITSIAGLTDGGTRTAIIAGTNLTADTRILFDGVQAPVRGFEDGKLTVVPPPAAPGHRAVVSALNSDGQSSFLGQSDTPPMYIYPAEGGATAVALTPAALSPGMEAMIQVDGLNTNFTEGLLNIGFGNTDVSVRQIWVASRTRAYVNLQMSADAQPGFANVTVVSGLNVIQQPNAFQIQAPQPRPFWISSTVLNPATGASSLYPGNPVTMMVGAAPVPPAQTSVVLLDDRRLPVTAVQGNQFTFQLPANVPVGRAIVRLETAGERSLPVLIRIDEKPALPQIATVATASSSQARSLKIGDIVALGVTDAPPGVASKISVSLGGKEIKVLQAIDEPGRYTVFIQVPDDSPTGESIALTVAVDGNTSEPISLTITR